MILTFEEQNSVIAFNTTQMFSNKISII